MRTKRLFNNFVLIALAASFALLVRPAPADAQETHYVAHWLDAHAERWDMEINDAAITDIWQAGACHVALEVSDSSTSDEPTGGWIVDMSELDRTDITDMRDDTIAIDADSNRALRPFVTECDELALCDDLPHVQMKTADGFVDAYLLPHGDVEIFLTPTDESDPALSIGSQLQLAFDLAMQDC